MYHDGYYRHLSIAIYTWATTRLDWIDGTTIYLLTLSRPADEQYRANWVDVSSDDHITPSFPSEGPMNIPNGPRAPMSQSASYSEWNTMTWSDEQLAQACSDASMIRAVQEEHTAQLDTLNQRLAGLVQKSQAKQGRGADSHNK